MLRDVYVVKDPLYFCAESLIQIDMCNDLVDKIFFPFSALRKRSPFRLRIPEKNIHLLLYVTRSILHINGENKIRMWKTRRRFSTMIL